MNIKLITEFFLITEIYACLFPKHLEPSGLKGPHERTSIYLTLQSWLSGMLCPDRLSAAGSIFTVPSFGPFFFWLRNFFSFLFSFLLLSHLLWASWDFWEQSCLQMNSVTFPSCYTCLTVPPNKSCSLPWCDFVQSLPPKKTDAVLSTLPGIFSFLTWALPLYYTQKPLVCGLCVCPLLASRPTLFLQMYKRPVTEPPV